MTVPRTVHLIVDGRSITASSGVTVAAAMMNAGETSLRRSSSGEPRGALCGMGVCHECRLTIDGVPHRRSCMVVVADGMVVVR